jgi:hypothetical protein
VATEYNLPMFYLEVSSLLSKYQAESEKNLKELFELAREAGKCVLFFDEITGMLDGPTLQRFDRRFLLPLPDTAALRLFFKSPKTLPDGLVPSETELDALVEKSQGKSFRTLSQACNSAKKVPYEALAKVEFWTRSQDNTYSPTKPCAKACEKTPLNDKCLACGALRTSMLQVRTLGSVATPRPEMAHFLRTVAEAKEINRAEDLKRLDEFTAENGTSGATLKEEEANPEVNAKFVTTISEHKNNESKLLQCRKLIKSSGDAVKWTDTVSALVVSNPAGIGKGNEAVAEICCLSAKYMEHNADLGRSACAGLFALFSLVQPRRGRTAAVDTVLAVFSKHAEARPDVALQCLKALQALEVRELALPRCSVLVKVLINALGEKQDMVELATAACAFIGVVAHQNPKAREEFGNAEACQVVVGAVKQFGSKHAQLALQACFALSMLALSETNANRLKAMEDARSAVSSAAENTFKAEVLKVFAE